MIKSASQKKHASERPIENRVAVRRDTYLKIADLIVGEEELNISASVLDASSRGLRLYVDSSIEIPKRFKVVLYSPHETYDCALVWQKNNEIGLEFIF